MRSILLAGAALALTSAAAMAAPTIGFRGATAVHIPAGNPGLSVLYTNGTDSSGVGILSQNFEKAFAPYSAQGADDFVVPAGTTWTINEIDVSGAYFNGAGPAISEDVRIYKDRNGSPFGKLAHQAGIKGTDDGLGNFSITLPTPIVLPAGTYWVAVVANMFFSKGGEWGWNTTATSQAGSPAHWKNGGGALGTGCTTWGVMQTCLGAAGEGPDFLFTLKGSAK